MERLVGVGSLGLDFSLETFDKYTILDLVFESNL